MTEGGSHGQEVTAEVENRERGTQQARPVNEVRRPGDSCGIRVLKQFPMNGFQPGGGGQAVGIQSRDDFAGGCVVASSARRGYPTAGMTHHARSALVRNGGAGVGGAVIHNDDFGGREGLLGES